MKRAVILSLLMALPAAAQQQPFPPFEVDQLKVDRAIENGVKHLKSNNSAHLKTFEHANGKLMRTCELVLYTYVHAGVPENDPAFKELWDDMFGRDFERTYLVSLQAMILEDIQRVKYQKRIAQCAQFILDNQFANGRWSYGDPSIYTEDVDIPTTTQRRRVASRGGRRGRPKKPDFSKLPPPGVRVKPPVVRTVKITQKRTGRSGGGDNSNTQYAALGLRACHDSGIILPKDLIKKAADWWRSCQKDENEAKEELLQEGGVVGALKVGQKIQNGVDRKGRATFATYASKRAKPGGWCYGKHEHKAYGSMSAGAIGSLAIYDYILDDDGGQKQSWKNDKDVHQGLVWIAKNFSVTYNPGPYEHANFAVNSQSQYYYYLYALERAGMLYGTEVMGDHKWYPEGAKVLIENQKASGAWGGTAQTCFAILFLKRATAPLSVATHSAGSK